ncbi:MAG: LysR family transcriptional regulator [Oscillibacter sp.]|nr:LysR family transcriptional regulator [Oscillibacter sp.]
MDLDNIKTFVTVANLGNYTKAAEELNYAQSTVTSQIQQLEQELKFPLFERIGRKNYLTASGQEFLPHALEIMHILQQYKAVGQDPREVEGTLRIGVLESLVFAGVLGILPEFRNEFPKVDVMLKIGQAAEVLELLKQNQLDLIYISNALSVDPSIICAYSRREEIVFVTDAEHALAKRKNISLEEVLSYPFVVAEKSGRCYGRLVELAAEHKLTLHASVMVDNIVAITALLCDAQSVTFLAEYALEQELKSGELVKLDVDHPPQIYYSQILYHKNKYLAPFAERFIELIRGYRPDRE